MAGAEEPASARLKSDLGADFSMEKVVRHWSRAVPIPEFSKATWMWHWARCWAALWGLKLFSSLSHSVIPRVAEAECPQTSWGQGRGASASLQLLAARSQCPGQILQPGYSLWIPSPFPG